MLFKMFFIIYFCNIIIEMCSPHFPPCYWIEVEWDFDKFIVRLVVGVFLNPSNQTNMWLDVCSYTAMSIGGEAGQSGGVNI